MPTLENRVDDLNEALYRTAANHERVLVEHFAADGPALAPVRRWRMQSSGDLLPVPAALLPGEAADQLRTCHQAFIQALELVFDGPLVLQRHFGVSWRLRSSRR